MTDSEAIAWFRAQLEAERRSQVASMREFLGELEVLLREVRSLGVELTFYEIVDLSSLVRTVN